jgi:tetratricopeptide (TPR) repeat protein
MVGGSSLIPQVRDAVEKFFTGGRLLTYDDRDSYQTAVARGAAYHALARALFGKGIIQPVTNDRISIRTASGEISLIEKGAVLPFPAEGYARSNALALPQDLFTGSLPLRVEVVAGDELRLLLEEIWEVTGPVSLGDPLALEYRLDENQVLDLKLWLAGSPELGEYARTMENPLTNVVNPHRTRLEIEETEEKLRTREIAARDIPDTLAELGQKYANLGQREKALDYLKRALAGKGEPDAGILNRMGMVAGELGDHEREEKFYREAAAVSSWSGPWFNLALMQERSGRIDEAIEAVERAISAGEEGPYVVLRAQLAEKRGEHHDREKFLRQAFAGFDAISSQSDWELGWFLTLARMSGDDEKVQQAKAEQSRRARGRQGEPVVEGLLPIQFRTDVKADR